MVSNSGLCSSYGGSARLDDAGQIQAQTAITNRNIHSAVDAWCQNPTSAQSTYGHISNWDTSSVTSMNKLFCEGLDWPCYESSCVNFGFNEVRGQGESQSGLLGREFRCQKGEEKMSNSRVVAFGGWVVHGVNGKRSIESFCLGSAGHLSVGHLPSDQHGACSSKHPPSIRTSLSGTPPK